VKLADFTDRHGIFDFLAERTPAVAAVVVARAALRTVPSLISCYVDERGYSVDTRPDPRIASETVLPIFRALATPWAAAAVPKESPELTDALRHAKEAVAQIGNSACFAAENANVLQLIVTDPKTQLSSNDVARLATNSIMRASAAGSWGAARRDAGGAVLDMEAAADLQALADGISTPMLARSPLWRTEMRGWTAHSWDSLRARLLVIDPNWSVWINWYLDRSAGAPLNESVELARVLLPEDVWKAGARAVNSRLRALYEDPSASQEADSLGWAARLSKINQQPLGVFFVRRGDMLSIDSSSDDDDTAASKDMLTRQLHQSTKTKAKDFAIVSLRYDNLPGWFGLGRTADNFARLVDCDTSEIPGRIGLVYDNLVTLGSFAEYDHRIRNSPTSTADPLDPEVGRILTDLIRASAPWLRRFPTARKLDDEAGAFLSRANLYEPAATVIEKAEDTDIISSADAQYLRALLDAAKRGEYQAQKAGARGVSSSKNLASMLALIISFEAGMIGNEAAGKSVIAANGSRFYVQAEEYLMALFEDAPADIKHALIAMIRELEDLLKNKPAVLPKAPKLARVNPFHRDDES
jgi:hypothetical protein